MKKNTQRQTGLKITDDINLIKKNTDNYVLVQDLLQNPYLINGIKINLRVYIVLICHKGQTDIYMNNNGFMYYAKQKFIANDKSSNNNITTGYLDSRDVYKKNPLTHADFKRYLDMLEGYKYHESNDTGRKLTNPEIKIRSDKKKISTEIFNRIEHLMAEVFISFKDRICKQINIYDNYGIQIFGADVAINNELEPQLMEINKGPDLNFKDKIDGNVKQKLINDIFEIIGIKPLSTDNGLKLILEM